MPSSEPLKSPHAAEVPKNWRRLTIYVLAFLAIGHSFLIMLWVAPTNPMRDAVGAERLRSYIYPYFEQSWSVFAPVPRRGGENVQIRAYVGDFTAQTGKMTDWYDVTSKEDQKIKYLVNPSRIHSATRRLGGNMNSLMVKLNQSQRAIVQGNYVDSPRTDLGKNLLKANKGGAARPVDVVTYMRTDEMMTRFATMYGTARWGKGVTMIQFRVGHRTVPNYTRRNEVNFLDVPFTYFRYGWRKAMPGDSNAQSAFNGYVGK